MPATREEIIAYFASDVNGEGLNAEVLHALPFDILKRMSELAGEGFDSWLTCYRRLTNA